MIKFSTPDLTKLEAQRVGEAIGTRWITNGPTVREFERRIAKMSQCSRGVAYDSCTGAMEMTLRALGIGPGDEVITTPYTYSATAEVIRNVGARIVFVDLGKGFEMDYEKVADAVTWRTKAVMPVDIGGKLCDYLALMTAVINAAKDKFSPRNRIQEAIGRPAIVADAAHSFRARLGNKFSGYFADFTCFSFHVLKNITTGGEGGMVVWSDFDGIDNDALETTLRLLGDHGQTSRDKSKGWEYDIALFGYNSIMTDIDAAMGLAQLDRFNDLLQKRSVVTAKYDDLFRESSDVQPLIQHCTKDGLSAMHLYPIRLPDRVDRDEVYRRLLAEGIPCNVHYKPLPMMTAYKSIGFDIKDFPKAYEMFKHLLTIPYHTELTEEEQEFIVDQIGKAVSVA